MQRKSAFPVYAINKAVWGDGFPSRLVRSLFLVQIQVAGIKTDKNLVKSPAKSRFGKAGLEK